MAGYSRAPRTTALSSSGSNQERRRKIRTRARRVPGRGFRRRGGLIDQSWKFVEVDAKELNGIFERCAEIVGRRNFNRRRGKERATIGGGRRSIVRGWALQSHEPGNSHETKKGPDQRWNDGFRFERARLRHGRMDYRAVISQASLFLRDCNVCGTRTTPYVVGKVRVTVVPCPGLLSIRAAPPCRSMMDLTRARPRPTPSELRDESAR